MSFIETFTVLCNKRNEKPSVVCKNIGLSNATYSYWKKSNSLPHDTTLLKIAEYFGVSVEYLKGSEEQDPDTNIPQVERINALILENGLKDIDVVRELNLANGVIGQWRSKKSKPSTEAIVKLSKYFNVTTDYLLGLSEEKKPAEQNTETENFSEQEKSLLRLFRGTTEEGRLRIIQSVLNICDSIDRQLKSKDIASDMAETAKAFENVSVPNAHGQK